MLNTGHVYFQAADNLQIQMSSSARFLENSFPVSFSEWLLVHSDLCNCSFRIFPSFSKSRPSTPPVQPRATRIRCRNLQISSTSLEARGFPLPPGNRLDFNTPRRVEELKLLANSDRAHRGIPSLNKSPSRVFDIPSGILPRFIK